MTQNNFNEIYNQVKTSTKNSKEFLVGELNLNYGDLFQRVEKCVALFHYLDLKVGDRVVLLCADEAETSVFFVATLLAGLSLVVLDPKASNSEIILIIDAAEPAAIFMDEEKSKDVLNMSIDTGVPLYRIRKQGFAKNIFGLMRLNKHDDNDIYPEATKKLEPSSLPLGDIDYNKPALILFTSGTTSTPKGVELTFKNVMAQQATYHSEFNLSKDNRIINHLPLHHTDGLNMAALMTFCVGATWIRPSPSIDDILYGVQRYHATHLITVPAILTLVYNLSDDFKNCFASKSFKYLISTAAHLDESLWVDLESYFNIEIANVYGLTETVSQAMFCGPDHSTRKVGTIGKPKGCEAKIVNAENHEMSVGDTGELALKGDIVMKGYFRNEQATDEVLKDGWFYTGDLATVDEDGFYRIVGRKKNMINRSGLALYPEDITTVITQMNQVTDAVTIGLPDQLVGECVVSCVIAGDPELTKQDVIDQCRKKLAQEKIPNHIIFMEEFPRGAAGKVERSKIEITARNILNKAEADISGNVLEQVLQVAAGIFNVPIDSLSPSSSSDSVIGWDSLAQLQLVVGLEKNFQVKLGARDVMNIKSLADAIKLIEQHLNKV